MEVRVDPGDWPEAIARASGPQLVVAGPGTGKTEFLVRRALHLIDEERVGPERILLLSFSRRGAADLRTRVTEGLGRSLTRVSAFTFHGLAHRLLEAHDADDRGVPPLLTGPEQVALVHELLASEDPDSWPLPYRGLLTSQTFANEVADFILRCGEQLIDPEALAVRATERADWRRLPAFLGHYQTALEAAHRLDYGSLQTRAVSLLSQPGAAGRVAAEYDYILVDEYQDTTLAQARILELLYREHRNLTAAGDPYQSIYSFRGARLGNIEAFPTAFPDAAGDPARRIVLTTSFRVPAEILDAAVRVTAGGRLPGAAGPVTPAATRGSVETYAFDQQTHEAEWIAATLERIHLREHTPYRRMAVLVRSKNPFLSELSRSLDRRGIPHDPPDARLVDHPAVRVVLDCVTAATHESEAAMRRLLLGPLFRLPLSAMRELRRRRSAEDAGWPDVLRSLEGGGSALAGLLEDPSWAIELPAADGFWHLWSTLPAFAESVTNDRSRADRIAWSSLAQVLTRLGERDPQATLADYVALSITEDFEATPLLEFHAPSDDRLVLTTLHQAKGLEFDVVVIADAREGVFPDLRARESLLGTRHLTEIPTPPTEYIRFRLQEEMRLAYTAMTRATRRVIWTCTTVGFEDGRGVPSRFLPLVAGADRMEDALSDPVSDPVPATPLEAEAWLRRTIRDPAHPGALRRAALGALVTGGPWRPRAPITYAGVLARGPDTGLIPPDPVLSPSQADAYLDCPRRYVLGRRLHIDVGRSVYQELGNLIHRVLEMVEQQASERGDPHGTLEDALATLTDHWDPVPFGDGPWAAAWRRRAERLLTRLYSAWPGTGRVIRVEHEVTALIGDTTWRGRIDRIEVEERDGATPLVRIVDYKTSGSAPSVAEVAASVQLGFYSMAAATDPEIAALGEVGAAEFWYPGTRAKGITVRTFDPAHLNEVSDLLAAAAAGITGEDWRPRPGPRCDRCPVRSTCPEWPDGREAYCG
jgi:superfamily I DNA/RNA helicase/RecB family exonuclease